MYKLPCFFSSCIVIMTCLFFTVDLENEEIMDELQQRQVIDELHGHEIRDRLDDIMEPAGKMKHFYNILKLKNHNTKLIDLFSDGVEILANPHNVRGQRGGARRGARGARRARGARGARQPDNLPEEVVAEVRGAGRGRRGRGARRARGARAARGERPVAPGNRNPLEVLQAQMEPAMIAAREGLNKNHLLYDTINMI